MWGGRGRALPVDFFFFLNGKENGSARQIDAICTGVLRFSLFIVDGKFAISARQTGHTRHELAPGPKGLLLSLRYLCLLSSERHPLFPFFLSIGLVFLLRVLSLTPPHAAPVPFQLLLPVPIYHLLCFSLCVLTHPLSLF